MTHVIVKIPRQAARIAREQNPKANISKGVVEINGVDFCIIVILAAGYRVSQECDFYKNHRKKQKIDNKIIIFLLYIVWVYNYYILLNFNF